MNDTTRRAVLTGGAALAVAAPGVSPAGLEMSRAQSAGPRGPWRGKVFTSPKTEAVCAELPSPIGWSARGRQMSAPQNVCQGCAP